MNGFLEAIERAAKNIQAFFDNILTGVLDICDKFHRWTAAVFRRMAEFLIRLFFAVGRIVVELLKILLVYVPGLIAVSCGFYFSLWWLSLIGISLIVVITLIGFFFRPRVPPAVK